jgi:hypothetical protein
VTKLSASITRKVTLVHDDRAAPLTFSPSSLVPTAMKCIQRHLITLIVLLWFVASISAFVSRRVLERKREYCSLSTSAKVGRPSSWPLTMSSTTVNAEKIDDKVVDEIL